MTAALPPMVRAEGKALRAAAQRGHLTDRRTLAHRDCAVVSRRAIDKLTALGFVEKSEFGRYWTPTITGYTAGAMLARA